MRTAVFTLLLAVSLLAEGEAPKREIKEGKLTDPYWSLTFAAPELQEGVALGGPMRVFEGSCAGKVTVEISVYEAPKEMPVAEWVKATKESWKKKNRSMEEVSEGAEPTPWILFVEKSLAGFLRHHGYAYYVRGCHCFEVHAYVQEKSETSANAIRAALTGLTLGPDAGGCVLEVAAAQQMRKPIGDPLVAIAAGFRYGDQSQPSFNPKLAVRLLEKGLPTVKEEDLKYDGRWQATETIGICYLTMRQLDTAIEWLKKSEAMANSAPPESQVQKGQSAYNLACAYSLASKLDEAFAALERAYTGQRPVDDEHLSADTDLDNMRKDPRWEEFWRTKVKGSGSAGG